MPKITTVLFDLDGTLLPLEQENFVKTYLGLLAEKMAPHGFDPQQLIAAIYKSCEQVCRNDGTRTNEQVFWHHFSAILGDRVLPHRETLDDFYRNEFDGARITCTPTARADALVKWLKAQGLRVVLATAPVFPKIATDARIAWAGLDAADFDLITTYENSRRCKPQPEYYTELLQTLGCRAEECLMVGNDTTDDLAAAQVGIPVFLLTDHLYDRAGVDISPYPHGNFAALEQFVHNIIK